MSFAWRRQTSGSPTTAVRVRISDDGGGSWATLTTIPLGGAQSPQIASFDMSTYVSDATTIRFEGMGSGSDASLLVDNVLITATFTLGSPTTTTPPTTSTSTTTTTVWIPPGPTTTTTTIAPPPGSSTTTSTLPGAPTSTTSTVADSQDPAVTTTDGATPSDQGDTGSSSTTLAESGERGRDTDDGGEVAGGLSDGGDSDATAADTPTAEESRTDALGDDRADGGDIPGSVGLVVAVQLFVLGSLVGVLTALGVDRREG